MATVRSLEVYLDLLSQPCRAVHILLTCNRIPHKVQTVALRKGENRTAEFTKLNPMKKVPVMVDNSFTLTERWTRWFWMALWLSWTTLWTNWNPCFCAGSHSCVVMTSLWRTCWQSVSSCR
uniref:Glutathione S-transferase theta 2 n=1 Tax=Takifugu rubripes TaxID=31033 RepID=A0A674NFW0_TAKRU